MLRSKVKLKLNWLAFLLFLRWLSASEVIRAARTCSIIVVLGQMIHRTRLNSGSVLKALEIFTTQQDFVLHRFAAIIWSINVTVNFLNM